MNKYIFLDFDGVLNSCLYYKEKPQHERWKEFKEKYSSHIAWGLCNIDPKAVELLNELTEATGAKLVISSSWRGDASLGTIMQLAGIKELIYGETPRLISRFRGQEIKFWLEAQSKPYRYVIIDDDSDMFDDQKPYFIHTDYEFGLTKSAIDKAIKILNE